MAKRKKVIVLNDDPEKKAAAECLIGQLRKIGVDLGPQYRPEIVGMIARDNGFHVPEILRPCG